MPSTGSGRTEMGRSSVRCSAYTPPFTPSPSKCESRTPGKAGGLILLAPQRGKRMESPKGDLTPAA